MCTRCTLTVRNTALTSTGGCLAACWQFHRSGVHSCAMDHSLSYCCFQELSRTHVHDCSCLPIPFCVRLSYSGLILISRSPIRPARLVAIGFQALFSSSSCFSVVCIAAISGVLIFTKKMRTRLLNRSSTGPCLALLPAWPLALCWASMLQPALPLALDACSDSSLCSSSAFFLSLGFFLLEQLLGPGCTAVAHFWALRALRLRLRGENRKRLSVASSNSQSSSRNSGVIGGSCTSFSNLEPFLPFPSALPASCSPPGGSRSLLAPLLLVYDLGRLGRLWLLRLPRLGLPGPSGGFRRVPNRSPSWIGLAPKKIVLLNQVASERPLEPKHIYIYILYN